MPVFRIDKYKEEKVVIGLDGIVDKKKVDRDPVKDEIEELNRVKNKLITDNNALKEKGEKIIQKAKQEARQIEDNARKSQSEGEKLIKQAQAEKKKILKEAQEEAENLKNEANSKGYDEGYTKGAKDGEEKTVKSVRKEYEAVLKEAESILNNVVEKKNEIIKNADKEMLNIIFKIARKIVNTEVKVNREIVYNNLKAALDRLTDKENVKVHVNKKDVQIIEDKKEEFFKIVRGLKNFKIIEENYLNPGDCIIETEYGFVDGVLDAQFDELEKLIMEEFNGL
ncbi:MAG: FliH/SctL family protein [Candidatus Muiribacteriota bacterium]